MPSSSPLAQVKALAGSKSALIEKVQALATEAWWVDRTGDKGLKHLSNAQLVRLFNTLTDAKKRFGSRQEIVDRLAAAKGHGKDADFKSALAKWPLPRLLDALAAAERAAKRAS